MAYLENYLKVLLLKKNYFYSCFKIKKKCFTGFAYAKNEQQGKFLSVVKGKILDVAVDCRKNSKTFGKHFKVQLSEKMRNPFISPRVSFMVF